MSKELHKYERKLLILKKVLKSNNVTIQKDKIKTEIKRVKEHIVYLTDVLEKSK